jgi:hypothetical protein
MIPVRAGGLGHAAAFLEGQSNDQAGVLSVLNETIVLAEWKMRTP